MVTDLTREQQLKIRIFDILEKQAILNNQVKILEEQKNQLVQELQQLRSQEPQDSDEFKNAV